MSSFKLTILTMLLLNLGALPAHAQELWVPRTDSPAKETAYFQPVGPPQTTPEPAWILRTGAKKGIVGNTLDAELFAGPDAAVLKNGFYQPWQSLLAEFGEPSVMVDPWQLAGLSRTKPYLIVPSGALRDLSASRFFKAGLAEYARSGGIIVCFAQQKSADLAGLPVPDDTGSALAGAGWSEDAGPLFRASSVQTDHPMLAGTVKTTPDIETSGYLTTYPRETTVVLSRPDGLPSLIVYPYGNGWVVLTSMFSDFSYERGLLNPDEKTLVRDVLLWAKSSSQIIASAPATALTFTLSLRGPERGEATSARIRIVSAAGVAPAPEANVTSVVKEGQVIALSYTFTIPAGMQPGIYHLEYLLADAAGRDLGVARECGSGWFSIGKPVAVQPVQRLPRALSGIPTDVRVQSNLQRSGGSLRLHLTIVPGPSALDLVRQAFFVHAADQEKPVTLGAEGTSVDFDIPQLFAAKEMPFGLYHASGRSIFHGSARLTDPAGDKVSIDLQPVVAGGRIRVGIIGLGKGEIVVNAAGQSITQMITGAGGLDITLPVDLPTGTYRLRWNFTPLDGTTRQGEVPVDVEGYRVRVQEATVDYRGEKGVSTLRLRLQSTRKMSSRMKLMLRSPDGKTGQVAEQDVMLQEGPQEVPLSFTCKPGYAGIGDLWYEISSLLPPRPGMPSGPLTLASGRTLFDIGETALLGVATAEPMYYEPAGPVIVSAYVFGKGRARTELFLDNRKAGTEQLELNGLSLHVTALPLPQPGPHTIRAAVFGEALESSREQVFSYGTRFPDLTISIRPAAPAGAVMQVELGISNQGKSAAPRSRAALYEGDPHRNGTLIGRADVPQLDPGASHVALIDWPLERKAGLRTLYAIADADNVITETLKSNNTATAEVRVPELLLIARQAKESFTAEESVPLELLASNLTGSSYNGLRLTIGLADSAGRAISQETVTLPALAAGGTTTVSRSIVLARLPLGTYQLSAQAALKEPIASVSSQIRVLPTLLLGGSLETSPESAVLCSPLHIRYKTTSLGNIPASTGSIKIEIRSAQTSQPAFFRQLPLTEGAGKIEIDRLSYPPGPYTVALKASAMNAEHRITREFTLAERALTISAPLEVHKSTSRAPRVLLWRSKAGTTVQRAVSQKIVQEALEQNNSYSLVVERAEDFLKQATSGNFNTAVLFETDELPEPALLNEQVSRGLGLVIIGAGDKTRLIAEKFGFAFTEPQASNGSLLMFPEGTGFGLSGTIPISGKYLLPQKNSAAPAALFVGDRRPAALLDEVGSGRVLIIPFSLSRSALDTGASPLFSLLLRAAVRAVAPGGEERTRASQSEITVTAASHPVKARVVETLPAGSRVVWVNAGGIVQGNTVTYDLAANTEQQKLLCLYQPPAGSVATVGAEAFYECNGKFLSQGNVNE